MKLSMGQYLDEQGLADFHLMSELGFDGVEAVVNKLVPPKKAALIELNMKALQMGKEYK